MFSRKHVASLLGAVLTAGAVAAAGPPAAAASDRWFAAWATSVHAPIPGNQFDGPNWSLEGFTDQSVRQVVRVSAGGSEVRIRLSNAYGSGPLRLTGATVAQAGTGAGLKPGTVRPLRFGGDGSTVIPAGRSAVSDPVRLRVSALDSLTITLYFKGPSGPATFHQDGLTTTYRAAGDHRRDEGSAAFGGETSHSRYFITGVDVTGAGGPAGTVVAFGDSITDGHGSTAGADNRYPDQLAERLVRSHRRLSVVNAGIGGNKLLADSPCYGERAVTRFSRDALSQPGVRTVVVLEGVNDIGAGGYPDYFGCGASPEVTGPDLIAAHRQLIRSAHRAGVRVVGATITPMKNFTGYYSADKERVRDQLNDWIRTSGEYDAVVDLDRMLSDPQDPDALAARYDFGDGLHLNDAGADRIADAIFRALCC
ncbi:SGNH/GDSL hydrolase family protein [Phytohabitans flavus]|uniref:SGNH hydrolase n=1 Tax=Phytohabitans flavus TaxID=1076124 RepID=A0A6F8XW94_9ACTN|nr:SGNH/GDSL hydrolase family protein [Phytohabitans flavus]BCB78106.1 SGNH hydrolase [Phytohabitans flavus]